MMASSVKKPAKYVCTLSPELLKKAKEELNEDPERRELDIQQLRERIENHPGLYARTDASFLIRYLRARKFHVDRAFETILNFYRIKQENTEIFDKLQPSVISHVLDEEQILVIPDRDEQGRKIVIFRLARWNPAKVTEVESFKDDLINLTKISQDEETQVNGVVMVIDFKDSFLKQMLHSTPGMLKKWFAIFQDSFPMRIKEVHYVHELFIIKYIFPIIKLFMKKKLLERLHFHASDYASLHKFIKPELLPDEYGGLNPIKTNKDWRTLLDSCEEEFIEDQKYCLEKVHAVHNANKEDAMETLPGLFKQLES